MKYTVILLTGLFFLYPKLYAQKKDTFYIDIAMINKQGSQIFDLHADEKDSFFSLTINNLPNSKKGSGFILLFKKDFKKLDSSNLINKKIITPITVMDSLNVSGESFFKKNNFYVLFKRHTYMHKVSLAKHLLDRKNDYKEIQSSRITLHNKKK